MTGQAGIRVVVADGQPLFRDALARTVRQDSGLQLVGEAADGRDALAALRRLRPAVALLALDLPALDGRRVLDAINRDELGTAVVVVAGSPPPEAACDAVAAGARGCVSRRAGGDDVRLAVRRAADGEAFLCREVQTLVTRELRLHRADPPLLSPREREVLRLTADGLSGREIAQRLHVAPSTVKTYLQQAYERLGVRDRAHAVAEAMRRGLLE